MSIHIADSVTMAARAAPDPDKPIRIARFFSYPKEVLYLLASFIALLSICHFLSLAYTFATRKCFKSAPRSRGSISLLRLPRACADFFRWFAFRWVISVGRSYTLNIAELFLTASYIAVLFGWTLANTKATTGVEVDPHYYGNRAGTIAASQLPIIAALGMRNNIFSWLTGISFDKLNYLHRMSSRVLCVLVWLHGAGRLAVGLEGEEDTSVRHAWVKCGFLAASTLTVLCISTIRPIRERSYEVFLIIHFSFTFIFLLSVYFHMNGRLLTYYGVWPAFVVWGLDRFLRMLRIAVINFGYFNPWSSTSNELDAEVDILSPYFLRVSLRRPKYFKWRPGQSVFLSLPQVSTLPFESHPFTISTINRYNESINKLVFLLRVRKGFTRRLLDQAAEGRSYQAFVDGPYSSPPLIMGYHTVVLIAGGSGVAFTLPLLLDLIYQSGRGESVCSKVKFVWAIRDLDHLQWIEDSLSSAMGNIKDMAVEIQIFITTGAQDVEAWEDDSVENGSEHKAESAVTQSRILELPFVRVEQGRPDLRNMLDKTFSDALGSVSVNVCGTHALANAVRNAISPRPVDILKGGPSVVLHVEAFGSA